MRVLGVKKGSLLAPCCLSGLFVFYVVAVKVFACKYFSDFVFVLFCCLNEFFRED